MKLFCPHSPDFVVGLRLPSILLFYILTGRKLPGLSSKGPIKTKKRSTPVREYCANINQYSNNEAAC